MEQANSNQIVFWANMYLEKKKLQKEAHAKWYQKNKDEYNKKQFCAICGGSFSKTHTKQHIATKKHQEALNHFNELIEQDF